MATEFPIKANVKPAVADITALENAIRKAGKEANLTEKEIKDIVEATRKAKTEGGKNLSDFNNNLGGINNTLKAGAKLLVGFFAVDRIKQFVTDVIKVTAEFQKLEAVLTNTLGSRSQAQRALADIQKFAAKTPFSVLQLTDSFVKLTNQGFKPTQEELRKLGDLASSQAKGFDQLTEAIIDAQTGEFERLKEFGIRASKEGDKVTFTFKGVQTQTEFTSDSIRNYILSLGDAAGVSGSMAAISETLEGKISNLGDAFDNFLKTLGSREDSQRITNNFLFFLQEKLGLITDLVETDEQKLQRLINGAANSSLDAFKASGLAAEQYIEVLIKSLDLQRQRYDALQRDSSATQEQLDQRFLEIESTKASITAIREYVVEVEKSEEAKKRAADDKALKAAQEAEEKRLKKLAEEWRKLNEERDKFLRTLKEDDFQERQELSDKALRDLEKEFGLGSGSAEGLDLSPEKETGLTDDELGLITDRVDARKDELELITASVDARKEAEDEITDYTINAIEEVFRARELGTQREMALLQMRYEQELKLAGNNEEAKGVITRRFEQQRIQLLNKQAQQQQQAAIFSILANQGPAVAKTAATLGYPLAIPFIAAVLTLFGLTLANQRKAQAPRFAAKGDFDIKGPGTETSDSIAYMLSVGESVVPADKTRKFSWLLKPMIHDQDFDVHDLHRIIDGRLPSEYRPVVVTHGMGSDTYELAEEMRKTRLAIERKKETHLTWDEEGFSVWMGRENTWTKRTNKRYST